MFCLKIVEQRYMDSDRLLPVNTVSVLYTKYVKWRVGTTHGPSFITDAASLGLGLSSTEFLQSNNSKTIGQQHKFMPVSRKGVKCE